MIVHCARNAIKTGVDTFVCTDNDMIKLVCQEYDVRVMTTPSFNTGTDRIAWAADRLGYDFIVNLQGDEPLVPTEAITKFISSIGLAAKAKEHIWNGISAIDQKSAFDPNNVKAAVDDDGTILYMTRKPIRSSLDPKIFPIYLKQLGLYGFHKEVLAEFASMAQSRLESCESIEMLRWLGDRRSLMSIILECPSISVDIPEDLAEVERRLNHT